MRGKCTQFQRNNAIVKDSQLNHAEIQPCPYCNTLINGRDLVYVSPQDPLNSIYHCHTCGLLYKPLYNESSTVNVDNTYKVDSWQVNYEIHLTRMKRIVGYARKFKHDLCTQPILDVGAGIGLLYEALACGNLGANYVAIEPVTAIAEHLAHHFPEILVLNASVQRASIPSDYFGSAFVLGVDYLFEDIEKAFSNIASSVVEGGVVIVERNVFIDQKSYVGNIIKTVDEMFGSNKLIRNWFYHEQYEHYLAKYFEMLQVYRDEHLVKEGDASEVMFTYTYVCRNSSRGANKRVWIPKDYVAENARALARLG